MRHVRGLRVAVRGEPNARARGLTAQCRYLGNAAWGGGLHAWQQYSGGAFAGFRTLHGDLVDSMRFRRLGNGQVLVVVTLKDGTTYQWRIDDSVQYGR